MGRPRTPIEQQPTSRNGVWSRLQRIVHEGSSSSCGEDSQPEQPEAVQVEESGSDDEEQDRDSGEEFSSQTAAEDENVQSDEESSGSEGGYDSRRSEVDSESDLN
jgi:hypothetical protein